MHEDEGMHLIRTCTGNEVGSCYVLVFGSWITFVSCNALRVTLHIRIGDRTIDKKTVDILIGMMIIDSYQRLKDPYSTILFPSKNDVGHIKRGDRLNTTLAKVLIHFFLTSISSKGDILYYLLACGTESSSGVISFFVAPSGGVPGG